MTKSAQTDERGRPALFSRTELIKEITELFWTHGYENLSFNNIAKEVGLHRSSLYNTFKTKEQLFLECLEYYSDSSPAKALHDHKAEESVGLKLNSVLQQICEIRSKDKRRRGCFAANAVSELIASDSSLGKILQKRNHKRKNTMISLIEQAIAQKELAKETDPKITAGIILSFITGLNVQAKEGVPENELKDMCKTFLSKIGFC